MKNILFFAAAVIFTNVFSGCVNSGPAPQDVPLQNPDGKAVIIKDMYSLPLIENKKLKETEIVKIFFPKADNVRMKCSMTLIKIPSGVQPPKYKQTSAQIIYAISGGGKMTIDGNMIILKKGIMVYVPPNVPMSITNNVNSILELIIVTSPPFETSQMTMLEKKTKKVAVATDSENSINTGDDEYQAVSEKYKTTKKRSKRTLSIEEYRSRINNDLLPASDENDPIADLLKDDKDKATPKVEDPNDPRALRMPDNSKVPLKKLEKEQEQQLIPTTPQKVERTSLKHIQDLTIEEHKVPIDKVKSKPGKVIDSSETDQDSLEKLLNDQKKQQEKLIPKKALKAKKTSLKHIQKLEPEENVPTKSDTKTTL
ncbi:MAG: cupin domain-containing protein [Victivallales bacterium]|nr:cupin domain-containing protein [Victivallales bacterium]